MFNPNNTTDVKNIWDNLGTIYHYVKNEDKYIIEQYWKALLNGLEGLYFNLAQALTNHMLSTSTGYLEYAYNPMNLFPSQGKIEQYLPVTLDVTGNEGSIYSSYYVTGVDSFGETNISNEANIYSDGTVDLSWTTISGLTYNVYKKFDDKVYLLTKNLIGNTYTDYGSFLYETALPNINTTIKEFSVDLEKNRYFLTMPIVSGIYNNIVLEEGIDYIIDNYTKLKFIDFSRFKFGEYVIVSGLSLAPILKNLFLPSYSEIDFTYKILNSGYYNPYLDTWYTETNDYEKEKIRCTNLIRWANAVMLKFATGPTLKNLRNGLALLYNYPFSYENGRVANIESNHITITGNSSYTYYIPEALSIVLTSGDYISKYDLLCSGIAIDDYISNSGLLTSFNIPNSFYSTISINTSSVPNTLAFCPEYIEFFKSAIIPPHINIIEY